MMAKSDPEGDGALAAEGVGGRGFPGFAMFCLRFCWLFIGFMVSFRKVL